LGPKSSKLKADSSKLKADSSKLKALSSKETLKRSAPSRHREWDITADFRNLGVQQLERSLRAALFKRSAHSE
jgi:hypothetical protein